MVTENALSFLLRILMYLTGTLKNNKRMLTEPPTSSTANIWKCTSDLNSSVSTPAMLTQLTLNINSLTKQLHPCTGHYLTRCLIHGVSKNLFCNRRKDISLRVQRAPQQVTGGSMVDFLHCFLDICLKRQK